MRYDVALTGDLDRVAKEHLLRHYRYAAMQEDLCFALWYPSHGSDRLSALINKIILPLPGEVDLHGNASFEGRYVTRVVREARDSNAGIAIMHSHPSSGWQNLSVPDIEAERDYVAYVAHGTSLPLVGMTVGCDGYWSGRFWSKEDGVMVGRWCRKVRVPGRNGYGVYWNPSVLKRVGNADVMLRTLETWGVGVQEHIQNLRIGIVGVGSVGAIAAETLARIGISEVTLIDPDSLRRHNLDRFLYGRESRVGERKVERVKKELMENSTAQNLNVRDFSMGIEVEVAYRAAIDCDLILSCVDRPVARDVLNYIAMAHLIPVIEAGVAVDVNAADQTFNTARWRSYLVVPSLACLRCSGQYNSSAVVAELDGSLDDPSYIENLPPDQRPQNQNVFPFSIGSASMQANLMLRYLLAKAWWPPIQRQEYRFIGGKISTALESCRPHCSFLSRIAYGDRARPSYLRVSGDSHENGNILRTILRIGRQCLRLIPWVREETSDPESAEERI